VKRLLPFLARLTVISLLFLPVLPQLHHAYRYLLALITTASVPTAETIAAITYDSSSSIYTFLVLILATPGMKIKRRVIGIITGIVLISFTDFFMTAVWTPYLKSASPSLSTLAVRYAWFVMTLYLLPFLLWLVFAFRKIEILFKGQKQDETT